MDFLFRDEYGRQFGEEDIYNTLKEVGAGDCEALFLHSDVMFGNTAKGFSRKEYLSRLYSVFEDLNIKYLIVPVFTYSFCNGEDYNVRTSRTSMGAFNEFIRGLFGGGRSFSRGGKRLGSFASYGWS